MVHGEQLPEALEVTLFERQLTVRNNCRDRVKNLIDAGWLTLELVGYRVHHVLGTGRGAAVRDHQLDRPARDQPLERLALLEQRHAAVRGHGVVHPGWVAVKHT